jgi:glycosyltransferase A (GT-A) superfamily protein (DUF2064 family)
MSDIACALLVVAKAPVPGLAKTRLTTSMSNDWAAELAAAALLDTLRTVLQVPVTSRVVAITGVLSDAARHQDVAEMLREFTVIDQRGVGFAERLVAAHGDTAAIVTTPVLQIGMDTPQVTVDDLANAARRMEEPDVDAVLGPASDGGWWALGVRNPTWASVLNNVTMSQTDTGTQTLGALRRAGANVVELPVLSDVDTFDDVVRVARETAPDSYFRAAVDRFFSSSENPTHRRDGSITTT